MTDRMQLKLSQCAFRDRYDELYSRVFGEAERFLRVFYCYEF